MPDFTEFQDFIATLSDEKLIMLLIVGVLLFALGVIVGWIVQNSKTRRVRKQLVVVSQERDDYQRQFQTAETARNSLAQELERVSEEKVAAIDRARAAERTLEERTAELADLRARLEQTDATNQSYATTIEDLNDQVIGLKTRNEQLLAGVGNGGGHSVGTGDDRDLGPYLEAIEARFQAFERRLDELSAGEPATRGPNTPHRVEIGEPARVDDNGEPLVIRADTTEPGARIGNSGRTQVIVNTTPSLQVPMIEVVQEDFDDLTEINAIGPFNQRKLNEHGIYSYAQIAAWTDEELEDYAQRIGYPAAIMREEKWTEQAAKLAQLREADPERYQRSPVTTDPENLKVVEGIGPKIEAVLHDAGIGTLAALAETPVEDLRAMLDQAGGRFRSHDPVNWPVQAALAVDGKWEQLRHLQAELKGGR